MQVTQEKSTNYTLALAHKCFYIHTLHIAYRSLHRKG